MAEENSEHAITDLESLVEAIEGANDKFDGQVWWRGLDKWEWDLVPSVHREDRGPNFEQASANRFVRRAPSRYSDYPPPGDLAAWLFLMQHHRMPTRLLDWTESPLIATFFAMDEDKYLEEDGALVALSPMTLNLSQAQMGGLFLGRSDMPSIQKAFFSEVDDEEEILAILPTEVNIRLMTQLSVFTIHGRRMPIGDIDGASEFLLKYQINHDSKTNLRADLKKLGIRESNLFPDLEHLAKEIEGIRFKEITDERELIYPDYSISFTSGPVGWKKPRPPTEPST